MGLQMSDDSWRHSDLMRPTQSIVFKPQPWPGYASALQIVLMLAMTMAIGGCSLIGFAAHVIAGKHAGRTVTVSAQYNGLDRQSVAVLVSADEYTYFEHPDATAAVCRRTSALLASSILDVRVIDPDQITDFQKENPYWNTLPHGQLLQRLQVDRLIIIDLIQYTLHEPGNIYVWRGAMAANVGVATIEESDLNQFIFNTTVEAHYPQSGSIGVINADQPTIQFGLLQSFTQQLVDLFQDHDEAVKL